VLLVEDDGGVRRVNVETLRDPGYNVIEAAAPAVALSVLEKDKVDLLFTDVVMPGMNGRQLAERATGLRPGLKVLFTTGHTSNAIIHNGVLDPGVQLITKPFRIDQLARRLREILT